MASFALAVIVVLTAVAVSGQRPNVLFLLSDDLGYGEVGAMRQGHANLNTNISTPNIDLLMASGIRFTNFYANAECSVSRGSLMTGKHSGHATIRNNNGPSLGPADATFVETLAANGYKTSCIGKWHLVGQSNMRSNPAGAPWNKGCQRAFIPEDSGWMYPTDRVYRYDAAAGGLKELTFPVNAGASRGRCMAAGNTCVWLTDLTLTESLAELSFHANRQAKEKTEGKTPAPFFLYLAWSEPHTGYWDALNQDTRGNPVPGDGGFGGKPWPTVEKDHAAAITLWHDVYVKKVMDKLTQLGLRNNTIVIYASDNGASDETLDNGGHKGAFFKSSGPLRGYKLHLTDGGIRVPATVSWPGKIATGAVCDTPIAIWDLAPTILDLASVPKAGWTAGMDGVSLYGSLFLQPKLATGKVAPAVGFVHPPLYWERCSNGRGNRPSWSFSRKGTAFSRAIRDGPWKGVQLFQAGEYSDVKLFNMAVDIYETTNVAKASAANVATAARLKALLNSMRTSAAGGFSYPPTDACTDVYGK
ncbi:unnamed protein product [Phaeothamnion confervicola]